MVNKSEINVFKITNLISNHSKESISAFCDYLKIGRIEKDKLYHVNKDGNDYTLVIKDADFFSKNKIPLSYFIVFDGIFNDIHSLSKNMNAIILSFPLFMVDVNTIPETIKNNILVIKKIYIDEGVNSSINMSLNPKFISSSKKVIPILSILETKIKKDIISLYKHEVSNSIGNFIFCLNELKNAIITSKESDGYTDINDWSIAPIFFSINGLNVWIKNFKFYTDIVIQNDDDEYFVWSINNNEFNKNKLGLKVLEIEKNKTKFVKWFIENHEKPNMILKYEKDGFNYSVYESSIEKEMLSAFDSFSNSILDFQQYCDYKIDYNIIKNENDLFNFDLGFESYKDLIGWILFGNTSFVWYKGGIKDDNRIIPYSLLETELPMDVENKFAFMDVSSQFVFSNALIYSIPDDVHESFKKHIKKGYEMLINKEFKYIELNNVDFEKIENRLKELNII